MKCKFCDAEMADWGGFCPVCGKSNAEEPPVTEAVQLEEEERILQEPEAAEMAEDAENEPSPKLKKMKRNMAMAGCLALLAVLATVLFFGIRSDGDVGKWFDWLKPKENNIYRMESYTAEDKKVIRKGDVVVATMGDLKLTNTQLQFYYWSQVYDFLNNYYYYLSYIGFDYTAPLDQQACYFDKNMTWQQYFLESALDTWQSDMAFVTQAKQNNFQLPEEVQKELDTMAEELAATAKENGYASVDAMVQESYGPGVTLQDFLEYQQNTYLSYSYFADLYEAATPTMEQLNAYFLENQQKLEGSGIKQDGTYTVDVRHILIHIETIAAADKEKAGETTDTTEKYTEEQWEACRKAAQEVLDAYLAGEMTEEAFAELAKKHSDDNAEAGGLYTQVTEGKMVAAFNDWCFDENRKVGDTGLVKTEFGYHVMYFVGSEEVWITQTRSAYMSDKSNEIVANALSGFEIEVTYKKIVLGNVTL